MQTSPLPSPVDPPPPLSASSQGHHRRLSSRSNYFSNPSSSSIAAVDEADSDPSLAATTTPRHSSTTPKPTQPSDDVTAMAPRLIHTDIPFNNDDAHNRSTTTANNNTSSPASPCRNQKQSSHTLDELRKKMGEAIMHQQAQYYSHESFSTDSGFADLDTAMTPEYSSHHDEKVSQPASPLLKMSTSSHPAKRAVPHDSDHSTFAAPHPFPSSANLRTALADNGLPYNNNNNNSNHNSVPQRQLSQSSRGRPPKKKFTRHPVTADTLKGINGPAIRIPDFLPPNATVVPDDSSYPTPNLYDITLALNADPGVDSWWSNVVSIFKTHYGAERMSLAVPGDVTDLENVPWGQKATYNVQGSDAPRQSPKNDGNNDREPTSKGTFNNNLGGSPKAKTKEDGNTLKYTKSVSGTRRPKLLGRHSFAGYGGPYTKDKGIYEGNNDSPLGDRHVRRKSASGDVKKPRKHLRDEEPHPELSCDTPSSVHQPRLSGDGSLTSSPSTTVFPVPRALEMEPDALIKRTGVVKLFGRTKPVALTREYVHDPMEITPTGNNNTHRHHHHHHKDIIQTTPIAESPWVNLATPANSMHPSLPQSTTGSQVNSGMPNNVFIGDREFTIPFDPSPPEKNYEEYEQTPPSPWSQSPAPSPAPLSKPEINPFFSNPEVDEDAFASSPPSHDYSVSTPVQAIGVDRAKTVIHIPLIHSSSSRQTRFDTLRFPVAVISILSPIIPFPSNLRKSLVYLLPHLTTSFCLAQQYSQLEKQLSSSSIERSGRLLGLGGTFSDANSERELVAGLSGHVNYALGKDRAHTALSSPVLPSSSALSLMSTPDLENLVAPRNDLIQSPNPPSTGMDGMDGYFNNNNNNNSIKGNTAAATNQQSLLSPKLPENLPVPLSPVMQQEFDELASRDPGLVTTPSIINAAKAVQNQPPPTSRHSSSTSLTAQLHRELPPRPFPDTVAQLMLNSVPLHLFLAKPITGEVIWTNAKFDAYRRSQPQEPRSRDPWQNVHAIEYENLATEWSKALCTGSQFTERVRVKRFNDDSAYRWFIFRANPLLSGAGELLYWIGSFLDVHEQHVSEMKAAQESEMFATDAKYRALANSIPQVVFEAAEYRGLISANEQWELYTGQSLEEAKNLGFAKYIHRDDLEKCGILSPPQVVPDTTGLPEFSRIILNSAAPSGDSPKKSQPSTSQSRAEAGNTGEDEFPSFSRGLTAELQRLHRKGIVTIQCDENGRDSYTTEIRFRSRKADFRWHLVRLVKVETTSFGTGEASWYGTCTDINDRKLLERELNTAMQKLNNEMESKTKFFSNMSHEIRTPLNGILGTIPFILDTHIDNDQRRMLDTIQNSSTNLRELVDNILDVSKVEAGKMNIVKQWFHVRSVLEDAIDTISSRAIDKGLELNYGVEPDVPSMVMGDRFRVRQVLINLMGNAVKFTGQGEIYTRCSVYVDSRIGLNPSEFLLNFEVVDTGKGFSSTDAERLMQRFSQIESNGSQQHAGSGLGLFLSKQLVEMHGGRLTPSSREGQGATFSFFVNVNSPPSARSQSGSMGVEPSLRTTVSSVGEQSSQAHLEPPSLQPLTSMDPDKKSRSIDSAMELSPTSAHVASTASPQIGNAAGSLEVSPSKPLLQQTKAATAPRRFKIPDVYTAIIICPFDYAREAIKQHIEQVIPHRVQANVSSILDVDDWKDLIKANACPTLTHLVIGLPDPNEAMEVMRSLKLTEASRTPTLVIIADIYLKRQITKLYAELLASGKKVFIVPKPIKPSSFSPIFDPNSERELSKDQNQDMAREINNSFKNMSKLVKEVIGNKGYRVLLVEDDETNRTVMLKYLEKVKLVSETAGNGQQCVDMVFAKEPGYYSLIICDIQMPVKNGYETCQEIRIWEQRNHFPQIPIMALSANAMMDQIDDAARAGFNDYVTKPIKHNELGKMMMDLLDPSTPQILLKDRKS